MKVLFVATRKNCDPTERELYEMDFMNELLGFRRSLLDLGLLTVAACTPKDVAVEVHDEYLAPIPYDTDADLIALSAKTSAVARACRGGSITSTGAGTTRDTSCSSRRT